MMIRKETFWFLLSSIVLFCLNFFSPEVITSQIKYFLLCLLVIIFGLPHGALDTLEAKQNKVIKNMRDFVMFNVIYLLLAALVFFSWKYYSLLMLCLFLIISALHFKEDWKNKANSLESTIIGFSIISLPVFFHEEKAFLLYSYLSTSKNLFYLITIQKLSSYLLIFSLLLISVKNFKDLNIVLQIITLILSSYLLEPIYYFIAFFCFFHSIKNFDQTFNDIKISNSNLIIVINMLATIIIGLILYFFYLEGSYEKRLSSLTFIGLASLTVPHMILKILIKKKLFLFKPRH